MGLVWVYFNSDNEYGNIKALVREEDIPFFESFGQIYMNPSEIPDSIVSETILDAEPIPDFVVEVNPDRGYGAPGSLEWYENNILVFETAGEITAYVKSITGKELYPGGKLADVKKRALDTIKEHIENDRDQSQ